MLCLGCFRYSVKHRGTHPTLLITVLIEGEPSKTYSHVGRGRSLAAAFSVFVWWLPVQELFAGRFERALREQHCLFGELVIPSSSLLVLGVGSR